MWHSSERVYLCTGEWFADFPLLTKTTKSGYRVFFEISLKTIRPSCILTGHLIYERTPFLNKAAPRNKNFVQKALRGEEGMGWWLGKKGKESFPTLRPPPPPLRELARKLNCCILTATMHRLSLIFHVFLLRSSCAMVIAFEQNIEKERNVMQ